MPLSDESEALLRAWTEPNAEQLAERSAWTRDWLALRLTAIEAAAHADADTLRARVAALADALTAIVHELEIGWGHGEDCGVWATDDETDEQLYDETDLRHRACDCGMAAVLNKADAALAARLREGRG